MTYKEIKEMYIKKGYTFRTEKMRLNIFGIRSKESKSNKFDDLGGIAWIDENGQEQCFNFWMTTDPGKYWLQNPMRKEGCAIMVPGQYLECYALGKHNGKYEALVQVKPMKFVRDNNKDTILDFSLYRDPEKAKIHVFLDIIGANFHRASEWQIVQWIEKYSGSCQVVQNPKTFLKIMELVKRSFIFNFDKNWTKFDYTLFEEL